MLIDHHTNYKKSKDDLLYWLVLSQNSVYLSHDVISRVVNNLSSVEKIWDTRDEILISAGIPSRSLAEIKKIKLDSAIREQEKILSEVEAEKIRILRIVDKDYPKKLKTSITNPPLLLFYKGVALNFEKCVAIVGTRNCSFHARKTVRDISRRLAEAEFVPVSGLARGIDIEAHCGALESEFGMTLAILAWFSPIYPDEHSELAKDIMSRGGVLSEYYNKSPGQMNLRINLKRFVDRNRITSELAKFIIIGETSEDGGTIRQAEWARKQHKTVFILRPSGSNEGMMKGYRKIIEKFDGIPFNDAEDLMAALSDRENLESDRLNSYQSKLL